MRFVGLFKQLHLLLGFALAITSCRTDPAHLPVYSPTGQLQAVIEVPAGTNRRLRYDPASRSFLAEQQAGTDRIIRFLPYPGNYGFIPSTLVEAGDQGDSRPLEILVLGESVASGTVMEVQPLGTLLLDKAGQVVQLVVAVPARPRDQILLATDLETFQRKYPAAKEIIQQWLVHHNPPDRIRIMGWKDEKYTEAEIARWMR
jgi:inorganic pyrophosphatase